VPPALVAVPTSGADVETPSAGDLQALESMWPAVVELVGAENALLSAVLKEARPVAVGDGELTLAFASSASFFKKKAEDPVHRAAVTQALRTVAGDRHLRVAYELRESLPQSPEGPPAGGPRTEEEWVARFVEEFEAEELPGEPSDPPEPQAREAPAVQRATQE
jgi:hypothetical protein